MLVRCTFKKIIDVIRNLLLDQEANFFVVISVWIGAQSSILIDLLQELPILTYTTSISILK